MDTSYTRTWCETNSLIF